MGKRLGMVIEIVEEVDDPFASQLCQPVADLGEVFLPNTHRCSGKQPVKSRRFVLKLYPQPAQYEDTECEGRRADEGLLPLQR